MLKNLGYKEDTMFIEIKNHIFNSKEIRTMKMMEEGLISINDTYRPVPSIQITFIDGSYEIINFFDAGERDETYSNAVFDLKRIKE